jgi:hypothetical protein
MIADPAVQPDAGEARCPFLEPARDDWLYPVTGYCRGLPQGALMIPTLFEYRTWCATDGHTACPIYQSKHEQGEVRMGGQADSALGNPVTAADETRLPSRAPERPGLGPRQEEGPAAGGPPGPWVQA